MTQLPQITVITLPAGVDKIALEVRTYMKPPGMYFAIIADRHLITCGNTRVAAVRNVVKRFKEDYGSIHSG